MTLRVVAATVSLVVGMGVANAKVRSPSETDLLQAACWPDVDRLCKDAIPDEGRITACMNAQKASVSKTCTDAYAATQAN